MKDVTSATFRDTFMTETEVIKVRKYNQVVGIWVPADKAGKIFTDPYEMRQEATVKDLSKELGKEAPKPDSRGRVSKGLGEIPGSNPPSQDMLKHWERSKPAPKK